jgi:hypothetical protein
MQLSNSFLLNFRHENALSYEYKIHTRNGNIATLDWNRDWFYQWLSGYDLDTCFLSLTEIPCTYLRKRIAKFCEI